MAHFAKIGLNNVVEQVVTVRNIDTMTEGGIEQESIGGRHYVGMVYRVSASVLSCCRRLDGSISDEKRENLLVQSFQSQRNRSQRFVLASIVRF